MKDKNLNLVADKLVKAFLKNKIINPISNKFTKKLSNAQKLRKLCESKIKKPIIGFKAAGTGIPVIKKLKENGYLVLSGILKSQVPSIKEKYLEVSQNTILLNEISSDENWVCLAFFGNHQSGD